MSTMTLTTSLNYESMHRPVRLTRRGRLLVTITTAVAAASMVLAVLTLGSPGATAADPTSTATITHTVSVGESLWSVAAEVAGTGDVRAVLQEIKSLNNFAGSTVVPGQVLTIPKR